MYNNKTFDSDGTRVISSEGLLNAHLGNASAVRTYEARRVKRNKVIGKVCGA